MTRFTVVLSDVDSKYLEWLKDSGLIKNYSDVIRPAVSEYISKMKSREGFQDK